MQPGKTFLPFLISGQGFSYSRVPSRGCRRARYTKTNSWLQEDPGRDKNLGQPSTSHGGTFDLVCSSWPPHSLAFISSLFFSLCLCPTVLLSFFLSITAWAATERRSAPVAGDQKEHQEHKDHRPTLSRRATNADDDDDLRHSRSFSCAVSLINAE